MSDIMRKITYIGAGKVAYSKIELEKDFEGTEMLAKGMIFLFFFSTGSVAVKISI